MTKCDASLGSSIGASFGFGFGRWCLRLRCGFNRIWSLGLELMLED